MFLLLPHPHRRRSSFTFLDHATVIAFLLELAVTNTHELSRAIALTPDARDFFLCAKELLSGTHERRFVFESQSNRFFFCPPFEIDELSLARLRSFQRNLYFVVTIIAECSRRFVQINKSHVCRRSFLFVLCNLKSKRRDVGGGVVRRTFLIPPSVANVRALLLLLLLMCSRTWFEGKRRGRGRCSRGGR